MTTYTHTHWFTGSSQLRMEPLHCELWIPPLDFLPFTFGYRTPGELWRDAVGEALAVLAGAGVTGGGFVSLWACYRCALPPAPPGDVFGLGAARIRRVRARLVPAWQAGKLPGVFDV